jgi:hypothetical protein
MSKTIKLKLDKDEGHWMTPDGKRFICQEGAKELIPTAWDSYAYDEVMLTVEGGDSGGGKNYGLWVTLSASRLFVNNNYRKRLPESERKGWHVYPILDEFANWLRDDENAPADDDGEIYLSFERVASKPAMEVVTYHVSYDIHVGLDGISEQGVRDTLNHSCWETQKFVRKAAGKMGEVIQSPNEVRFFSSLEQVRVEKVEGSS